MKTEKNISLKVVGDICFGGEFKGREPAYFLDGIRSELDADILAGNLECVLMPAGTEVDETRYPKALWAYENAADALKEAGFDIVWLANNHIMDLGPDELLTTKRIVEKRGILAAGGGADKHEARQLKVIEKKGIKVGFLAYAENCPQLNSRRKPGPAYNILEEMEADVTSARPLVDVLVVAIHADLEFVDYPSLGRMAYTHRLAELGADVIIEGHPHVPQGIEKHGRTLITYCLGNFIFDLGDYQKGGSPWTSQSYILDIELSKKGIVSHRIIPYGFSPDRPVSLDGEALAEFNAHVKTLCSDLADPGKMKAHDLAMIKRYLGIYIGWLYGAYQKGGADQLLKAGALPRFFMGEGRYWAEQVLRIAHENCPDWQE